MTSRMPVTNSRRRTRAALLRVASYVFLVGGLSALVYCAYVVAAGYSYQEIQKSRFESEGRNVVASMDRNDQYRPVADGTSIGEMKVPRLGLNAIFVQGDSPKILRRAVGHIADTALPGGRGNVVLTGHRDSFFRPLRNIRPGDTIEITTLQGAFAYQVDWTKVVSPDDIEVLRPSSQNTLTLVTCFPFYYVGPAPSRYIVRAHQVDTVSAPPSADGAIVDSQTIPPG
jgi:sortase A